jgi:succinate dehydrogenase / fumarate reductase flavoprotein subunit
MKYPNVERYEEWFVTSLVVENGRAKGLLAIDLRTSDLAFLAANAVIIATGGAGRLYKFTTNGSIVTGDGMAIAYRAGSPLKDMEFIQYHPTALPGTGILITEASRGEGGYLINKEKERFLQRYAPGKMELGPRDILSRAIVTEIREGRGFEGFSGSYVLLDLRHLGADLIDRKLPFVRELARNYAGIDPVHEPIPVRPGVHYTMGGIHTDVNGRTPISGLYACGEAACVSINGANRLGSNSLSECLVFGRRTGLDAAEYAISRRESTGTERTPLSNPTTQYVQEEENRIHGFLRNETGEERFSEVSYELQGLMETQVGVFRDASGLQDARKRIAELKRRLGKATVDDKSRVYNTALAAALELDFMLDVADVVAYCALMREESRGAHFRTDFPKRDDQRFLLHQLAYYSTDGPEIKKLGVAVTRWQPAERKY